MSFFKVNCIKLKTARIITYFLFRAMRNVFVFFRS
ncbi:TPA_asm: hypothetical protein AvPV1_gp19 [Archaeoglobus veneficus pleomorphic virus 1]|uniref:Uncharacterized protein n=1 Tax=Archaeoglobus veneficus pleomorphic virus 1 TaxID=3115750 RepID=A0AAT9JAM4_9VIRU